MQRLSRCLQPILFLLFILFLLITRHIVSKVSPRLANLDSTQFPDSRKFKLIDLEATYIIKPVDCHKRWASIVVLVHTALDHRETRDLIRETWGTNFAPEKPARMLFALGITDDEHTMRSIKAEANVFGDIVQGSFIDSYRNLSYKAILGHTWISEFCPEADLVVKADDDFMVDLPLLSDLELEVDQNGFLLACHVWDWATMPVMRGPEGGKWRIGEDLLPRNMTVTVEPNGREFFPAYCAGAFYVTNPRTSKALVDASKITHFVWIDDAWVTGYLAQTANITHTHLNRHFTLSAKMFALFKSMQSPDGYLWDYLSGPNWRSKPLSRVLTDHSRHCWETQCKNQFRTGMTSNLTKFLELSKETEDVITQIFLSK